MTTLGGEWRFASAVANRLQLLGALTQGDRRAAGGHSMQSFSLDIKYSAMAIDTLYNVLRGSSDAPVVPEIISTKYGENLGQFIDTATTALNEAGLSSTSLYRHNAKKMRVKTFLNRLLGIKVDIQNFIFAFFQELLEYHIKVAKANHKYSEGIVDIASEKTTVLEHTELYKCPRTDATTQYVRLSCDRGVSWEKAMELYENETHHLAGFYLLNERKYGLQYVLALEKKTLANKESSFLILVRPNTGYSNQDIYNKDLLSRY